VAIATRSAGEKASTQKLKSTLTSMSYADKLRKLLTSDGGESPSKPSDCMLSNDNGPPDGLEGRWGADIAVV
jgi:hypothetical protein